MTGFELFRKKKRLTQTQLANMLHISPAAVSKWEVEKGTPRVSVLRELTRLYGVTMEELLRSDYPDTDLCDQLAKEA